MNPPLGSQDVERRLLKLERCIVIRILCLVKDGKEIQSLKDAEVDQKTIVVKERHLERDRLDIRYLILKSRGIIKSLKIKS